MAGIWAVVDLAGPPPRAEARNDARQPTGALLARLLAERPAAPHERLAILECAGGAAALVDPGPGGTEVAGADPRSARSQVRGQEPERRAQWDLGGAAGYVFPGGRGLGAVVAAGPAASALDELAARRSADAAPLLPCPHVALRWDGEELRVELDELGAWPFYFRWLTPEIVALGTAALPLARLAPAAALDPEAIAEYLAFGQPLGTRTLYTGVAALPAGARARFRAGAARIERARIPDRPAAGRPLKEVADRIEEALAAGVAASLIATPGAPGVLLSGGLDSRFVLAELVRADARPRAWTFGAPEAADVRLASAVAEELRVPHAIHPWTPAALTQVLADAVALTDGQVPAHHLHGADLLPALRRVAGAQWNGFAGDAILGGSFAHPRYSLPGPLAPRLFTAFNQVLRPPELAMVLAPPLRALAAHPQAALAAALAEVPAGSPPERARTFLLQERLGRLAAVGLALDRHVLPVRTPFASAPVLAVMHELTLAERRYGRALAQALVRHFPRLGAIPWQRTGARPGTPWPLAALHRAGWRWLARGGIGRGPGLVDYGEWWRGPLAQLRSELLTSPALIASGVLDPAALGRLAASAPHTPRAVARDGVLMALALAAELLQGRRPIPRAALTGEAPVSDPARA